jgi:mono/diheme cytochrome c family protein
MKLHLTVLSLFVAAPAFAATPEEREAAFKADIFPIFEASCIDCHGKDPAKKPKGGFKLMTLKDIEEGYGKPGAKKPAVVWGDAAKSKLYTSAELGIKDIEDEHAMPPGEKKGRKPLTDEQLAKLKAFIDAK